MLSISPEDQQALVQAAIKAMSEPEDPYYSRHGRSPAQEIVRATVRLILQEVANQVILTDPEIRAAAEQLVQRTVGVILRDNPTDVAQAVSEALVAALSYRG